jgi:hypothetical protein
MRRSGRTLTASAVFAERSRDVDFQGMSITGHHGGLGTFTSTIAALTITLAGDTNWRWSFDGHMQRSDRWDFEVRPAGSDTPASEGRRQTARAHNLLVGTRYSSSSPWLSVRQTSADRRTVRVGNDGTHEPRNIPPLPAF